MKWVSIKEKIPTESGWYLAAIVPCNYRELPIDLINNWRKKFGCTKVWFNPDSSTGKWFEPDSHGEGMEIIDEYVTHWTVLPEVPLI